MQEGVTMLLKHISADDDILVIVDSDADGYTSAAILINYLFLQFPFFTTTHIKYQLHTGKQHGIILDKIDSNIKLVICPDSSSNDYSQHKTLHDSGVDVLVLDHHEADKISDYACIINNQLCDYPNKTLSGAGVVYKFCCFLDSLMPEEKRYANQFLDLAALGIISDVMSLKEFETKQIIVQGLANINNPYFKGMIQKNSYSLGDTITPMGIAFYITPYINATIRVGTQEEKLVLFESMLYFKSHRLIPSTKRGCKGQLETLVEQACRNSTNIKNRQTKNRDLCLSTIESIIDKNDLINKNKILAVQIPSEYSIDKNLTGLIANILMDKYRKPVLLLNQTEQDGDFWWEGSARGCNNSELEDFKELVSSFPTFETYEAYAQGHPNAYGFGMPDFLFDQFLNWSNEQLYDFNFHPIYKVDFIFNIRQDIREIILDIANLKSVWGQGIEEPSIAFEDVIVSSSNVTLMSPDKNPTLKISFPNGISCIKFKSSQEEFESLTNTKGCFVINLIGKCEKNEWGGKISPQIIITDYEIVGEKEYYF